MEEKRLAVHKVGKQNLTTKRITLEQWNGLISFNARNRKPHIPEAHTSSCIVTRDPHSFCLEALLFSVHERCPSDDTRFLPQLQPFHPHSSKQTGERRRGNLRAL